MNTVKRTGIFIELDIEGTGIFFIPVDNIAYVCVEDANPDFVVLAFKQSQAKYHKLIFETDLTELINVINNSPA